VGAEEQRQSLPSTRRALGVRPVACFALYGGMIHARRA
jgi:hypothetical protein